MCSTWLGLPLARNCLPLCFDTMTLNIQRHSWLSWVAAAVVMVLQELGSAMDLWCLCYWVSQPDSEGCLEGEPANSVNADRWFTHSEHWNTLLFFFTFWQDERKRFIFWYLDSSWWQRKGVLRCPQLLLDSIRQTWCTIGMFVAFGPNGVQSSNLLLPILNVLSGNWKALN